MKILYNLRKNIMIFTASLSQVSEKPHQRYTKSRKTKYIGKRSENDQNSNINEEDVKLQDSKNT